MHHKGVWSVGLDLPDLAKAAATCICLGHTQALWNGNLAVLGLALDTPDKCTCTLQSQDKKFKLIPSRWHVLLKVRQMSRCEKAKSCLKDIGVDLLS